MSRPVRDALVTSGGLCAPLTPYAATKGPDVGGLAMIAVYPSGDEANAMAIEGGQSPDKLHVTLIFLGATAGLDMEAVARAVARVARETAPLSGEVGGIGVFGAGPDGHPQIALPDVKGLSTLRTRLDDALAEEGISSPSVHGWTPHLTLTYSDDPELPDVSVIGKSLSFDNLSLTAEDVRTDFSFNREDETEADMAVELGVRYSRSEQRQVARLLAQAKEIT